LKHVWVWQIFNEIQGKIISYVKWSAL